MGIILFVSSIILAGVALIFLWSTIISNNRKIKTSKNKVSHPNKEIQNSSSPGKSLPQFPETKILFEAGMSNINHTAENQLNGIIQLLQSTFPTDFTKLEIHITGSADSSGNTSKNKILAKERCLAVKNYIERKLKKSNHIGTIQIPIVIQGIRVERGNTPRERELLRSVDVRMSDKSLMR